MSFTLEGRARHRVREKNRPLKESIVQPGGASEAVHANVGGTERGRRYATQQINRAYAVQLASEFQGFCRDLYSECMDHVVATAPAATQGVLSGHNFYGADPWTAGIHKPAASVLISRFQSVPLRSPMPLNAAGRTDRVLTLCLEITKLA